MGLGASMLLLLLANVAVAETNLTPRQAIYKVKISVLGGELLSRLDLEDSEYIVNSTVKPKGVARLIARGSIQEPYRNDKGN